MTRCAPALVAIQIDVAVLFAFVPHLSSDHLPKSCSKSALRKRLEKKPPKHTLYADNIYPWTAYKAMAYDLDDMQAICMYVVYM